MFLPPLLNIFCICWVHTISVLHCAHFCMKWSLRIFHFFEEISILCIDHLGMLSYLSLLFSGTPYSGGYIFPFLLCLLLLFFSQIFVRPPQTTILPFCISSSWVGFDHCLLYKVTILCPQFFRHSIRSNPLNLFVTSTV